MTSNRDICLAFDVYGTLLSTASIAEKLAVLYGNDTAKGAHVAAEWRKYQLEYTWRLNSMGQYQPFSEVTRNALQHTVAEYDGVGLNDSDVEWLMEAYNTLHVFPDVPPLFQHLTENPNVRASIFSNGTSSMIQASLTQSPELSPHANLFQELVLVEAVKRFKPHPDVYHHLRKEVGKEPGQEKDVWVVSGNPFDIVGANAVGLRTCWVDRASDGWKDRLNSGESGAPTLIVGGLNEVVSKVMEFQQAHV